MFNDEPAPTISVADGPAGNAAVSLEDIKPYSLKKNFDILLGDLQLYRLEMGAAQGREHRLKRFLDTLDAEDKYDLVLIDTPPTPSAWMTSALIASDGYLVPVKPDPISRVGIDLLRGIVNRCCQNFGIDVQCFGVVLTITETGTLILQEAEKILREDEFWKDKRFAATLPKRTAIAKSQRDQELILDSGADDAKSVDRRGIRTP